MGFFGLDEEKKTSKKNEENKSNLQNFKRPVKVTSAKGDSKMVEIPLKNGELLYLNNINRESFAIAYSDGTKTNLYTAEAILIGRGYPINDNIAFELPYGKFGLIDKVLLDGYMDLKDSGKKFESDKYNYIGLVTPFDQKYKNREASKIVKQVLEKRSQELQEKQKENDGKVDKAQEKIYKNIENKSNKNKVEIPKQQEEEIKRIKKAENAKIINDPRDGYSGVNLEKGSHYGETIRIRNVKRYSSAKDPNKTKYVYTAMLSSSNEDVLNETTLKEYAVLFTMPYTININGEQIKVGLDQVVNDYYDIEKAPEIQQKLLSLFSKAYSKIEETPMSKRKKIYDIGGTNIYGDIIENRPETVGSNIYKLVKLVEGSFEENKILEDREER